MIALNSWICCAFGNVMKLIEIEDKEKDEIPQIQYEMVEGIRCE